MDWSIQGHIHMRTHNIAIITLLLTCAPASAKTACQSEPGTGAGWSYRTKVGGKPDQCWYQGEKMRDRKLLYWPTVASDDPPMPEFLKPPAKTGFDALWRDLLIDMIPSDYYINLPLEKWKAVRPRPLAD